MITEQMACSSAPRQLICYNVLLQQPYLQADLSKAKLVVVFRCSCVF